jgi:Protein of unknown function (DUF2961)
MASHLHRCDAIMTGRRLQARFTCILFSLAVLDACDAVKPAGVSNSPGHARRDAQTPSETSLDNPESGVSADSSSGQPTRGSPGSDSPSDSHTAPGQKHAAPASSAPASSTTPSATATATTPRNLLLSPPQIVGTLVGPAAYYAQPNLKLYGAELGFSYEHAGQLFLLFGDTWPDSEFLCRTAQTNDDSIATLPLDYDGGSPAMQFLTTPHDPTVLRNTRLYHGDESLDLGSFKHALAGFSDGADAFALFQHQTPLACDPAANTCPEQAGVECRPKMQVCEPAPVSVPTLCEAVQEQCPTGQCTDTRSLCVDTRSSEYDGTARGASYSVLSVLEIGKARQDDPSAYDVVASWQTNVFSHLAARTVSKLSGTRAGNDYTPGPGSLLIWGRPGLYTEDGRQAQLYFATQELPFGGDAQPGFAPSYFAGIDPQTNEPRWSEDAAQAQPLALDGQPQGDPHEDVPYGSMTVSWLGAPIDKWLMLQGGGGSDMLKAGVNDMAPQRTPGAVFIRFADNPWGPWSPASPYLDPGSAAQANKLYGPGGILFAAACADRSDASCARGDPHGASSKLLGCDAKTQGEPGFLYAPEIIDRYTRANADGGLDITWAISTWNPYGVRLVRSAINPGQPSPVADEVADARALARLADWQSLPLLDQGQRHVQQTSRDRGDTDTTYPLSGHGNRDFNNFVCAGAQAQLGEPQAAPFLFDQPQCDESYVQGVALGRFVGAGRMVRLLVSMQSLLQGPADDERLRIYVDDVPQPRIDLPLSAAMDGSAGEIFAAPFGNGSALRLAWYYPVVFRQKLIVALDRLGDHDNYFDSVDVIMDEAAAPNMDALPSARLPERDAAARQLGRAFQPAGSQLELLPAQSVALQAGEARTFDLAGPATIQELRVRAASSDVAALANVRARASWDSAETPAIDAPLLALIGAGPASPDGSSLALTSTLAPDGRTLALKLPMPYVHAAHWRFENTGSSALQFELRMLGESALPSGVFGQLHTQHNVLPPTASGATPPASFLAASASGRGKLVGVCGRFEGHADPLGGSQTRPLNLLEGDVRVNVDGALAIDETGLQEYFDDTSYFQDGVYTHAFAQVWDVHSTQPRGQVSMCRWHVLGTEVNFDSELALSFELGGAGNPGIVDAIETTVFLYQPANP